MKAGDEILDFLVEQIPADSLANFQLSTGSKERVWGLIAKEKESGLLPEEKVELDDYLKLDHLVVLAKPRPSPPDMADTISEHLRREVRARAQDRCEYCLTPEKLLLAGCEVDHIISRKHWGHDRCPRLSIAERNGLLLCVQHLSPAVARSLPSDVLRKNIRTWVRQLVGLRSKESRRNRS